MLSAFERKLAMEDRATYSYGLARLNDTLRGEGPRGAVFELARDADRDPVVVDLGAAPKLGDLRHEVRDLIGQLLNADLPPRSLS